MPCAHLSRCVPFTLMTTLGLAMPLQAETIDRAATSHLDTLVVTAAATERTLQEAPASITVITAEDIARHPALDLAGLLGRVAGVTLQRSGNAVPGVQMRGLNQAYTAILIDGRRVNSLSNSFRGNDYDTGWVPAEMIERIEVVRGPMSALYGSDAVGGVINIITKKAGATWRGNLDATYIAQQDDEAGDSWKTSAAISGPLHPDLTVRLYAAADGREADAGVNASGRPGLPLNRNRSANGELAWAVDEANSLSLNLDTSHRNHAGFRLEREAIALAHQGYYALGDTRLSLLSDETRNLDGSVSGQANPNRANTLTAQGMISLPLAWGDLSLGAEWKQEKLKDPANLGQISGNPKTEVATASAFFEYQMPLLEHLGLTLGNRLDHHENFGVHNSPRAYLVWQANTWLTIKGGWATAFRAPTLLQNSPDWGSPSCGSLTDGCFIVGSVDLEPETSDSREISVLFDLNRWSGSLTFYRNDLRDMIDISSRTKDPVLAPTYPNFVGFLPDGRPSFAYQNLNKVQTQGVEFSLKSELTASLQGNFNYTYLDARNLSSGQPEAMIYKPRHVAHLGLDWQATEALVVNVTASYTGSQYTQVTSSSKLEKEDYTLVDTGLRYRFNPNLTLGAGLLNALDKRVERDVTSDYNEEGRRFYASMALSF